MVIAADSPIGRGSKSHSAYLKYKKDHLHAQFVYNIGCT